MRNSLLAVIMFIALSFAVTVSQSDWSGGSGVPGPVTNWGNRFEIAEQINHTGNALSLMLLPPVEHTVNGDCDGAVSVYATDVDGDGDIDVLGATWISGRITWWENSDTAPGILWTEHPVDDNVTGPWSVYATDLDGDGDTDVLGAIRYHDEIIWWENLNGTGTSWTKHILDDDFDGASSVYATDLDGDGDVDVLGAAYDADDLAWWENLNGKGTSWTKHTLHYSFNGAWSVNAADVDGDGDVDVLGAAEQDDDITWMENIDGIGLSWIAHTVEGDFEGATSVHPIDFDGDGDVDLLGSAVRADDITWWENTDGTGTSWTEHMVDSDFDAVSSVYSADLDGDGDPDVLGTSANCNTINWWENTDGAGTSWTKHVVDDYYLGAMSVYVTDVDGDGNVDVLGAAYYSDEISWWDVMGFSSVGTLNSSILEADSVDNWDSFAFNGDELAGTSLGFQFRSSQDPSSMGAWSDTVFTNTSLFGILADSTDFLQYRVILQTTDPNSTPLLNDVSFSYTTYLGIFNNDAASWSLAPYTNPSFGSCAVLISVQQPGFVNLVLHDITGRVIAQYSQELSSGTHAVSFNNLADGVYFCTLQAGEFTATERVIVLR